MERSSSLTHYSKEYFVSSMMMNDVKRASYIQHYLDLKYFYYVKSKTGFHSMGCNLFIFVAWAVKLCYNSAKRLKVLYEKSYIL